ncbi:MAG TPA: Uma2 family endonuclease [Blastocatellia bacterium]|nr:Uma2 family endonuclease [Blastocatellia bacterium]
MGIVAANNYLEIIDALNPGEPAIFHNVSWQEYEQLLDELVERSGVRLSYDGGTLEIMTISTEHDFYGEMLQNLVRLLSLRLKFKFRSFGHATMKKSKAQKGKEPDGCFFIKSCDLIGRRKLLDFENDPPPDIAVEIDLSTKSIPKLPIYLAPQVPEVWIYNGSALTVYRLSDQGYMSIERSEELPVLTSRLLTNFLNEAEQTDDDNQLLQEYVEIILREAPPATQ